LRAVLAHFYVLEAIGPPRLRKPPERAWPRARSGRATIPPLTDSPPPLDRRARWVLLGLLAAVPAVRLLLVLAVPDLVHDLDPGELKHMDLAVFGLPPAETRLKSVRIWLSGPENVHHGGFPVVSGLWLGLHRLFGAGITGLRLLPIAATTVAAAAMASVLARRWGARSAAVALALMVGAPPLFLKWSVTSRGGHLEGIAFPMVLAWALFATLRRPTLGRWLACGILGGFSVYFSYLAAPSVGVLCLGALLATRFGGEDNEPGGTAKALGGLLVGGFVGFLPWIVGLTLFDLPYFDQSIHQTANPDEAAEVVSRGVSGTLRALVASLPHNLWPWGVTASTEAAYASQTPDILVFEPAVMTWASRAIVGGSVALGAGLAVWRRAPLTAAVCLLPAAHHLFVLRMANTVGWPDVPHRYFVIVFPAVAAAAGIAVALAGDRWGRGLAGVLAVVALAGLISVVPWLGPPHPHHGDWDAARYRASGMGQVRVEDGPKLNAVLDSLPRERIDDSRRGVGMIYPAISDYFLLFRTEGDRREPRGIFSQEDPLANDDEARRAVVQGALAAAEARATHEAQLHDWICSWDPNPDYRPVLQAELTGRPGITCGWFE